MSFLFQDLSYGGQRGQDRPLAQKTIYLVQDAHSNLSGQKSVATIIQGLALNEKVKTIYLEAGNGNESLSFLRGDADAERLKIAAASYLISGRLRGFEFANLTSTPNLTLWGVEDMELYAKSLSAYQMVSKDRGRLSAYLDRSVSAAETLKSSVYGGALLSFDQTIAGLKVKNDPESVIHFISGEAVKAGIDPKKYPHVRAYVSLKKLETRIDFEKASKEQAEAAGSLDPAEISKYPNLLLYARYEKRAAVLRSAAFVLEVDALEAQLYERFAASSDEKKLLQASRDLALFKKLIALTLTPDEYTEYLSRGESMEIERITGFLNKKIVDLNKFYEKAVFLEEGYANSVKICEDFYSLTLQRDERFVANTLTQMKERGENKAVLITGGFHAPNLKRLFAERNVNVVSIVPRIEQETNLKNYESQLLGPFAGQFNKSAHTVSTHTNMPVGLLTRDALGGPDGVDFCAAIHGARLSAKDLHKKMRQRSSLLGLPGVGLKSKILSGARLAKVDAMSVEENGRAAKIIERFIRLKDQAYLSSGLNVSSRNNFSNLVTHRMSSGERLLSWYFLSNEQCVVWEDLEDFKTNLTLSVSVLDHALRYESSELAEVPKDMIQRITGYRMAEGFALGINLSLLNKGFLPEHKAQIKVLRDNLHAIAYDWSALVDSVENRQATEGARLAESKPVSAARLADNAIVTGIDSPYPWDDLRQEDARKAQFKKPYFHDFLKNCFAGQESVKAVDIGTGDGWFVNEIAPIFETLFPGAIVQGVETDVAFGFENPSAFLAKNGPESMDFVSIVAPDPMRRTEQMEVADVLLRPNGVLYISGNYMTNIWATSWLLERGYSISRIPSFNQGPPFSPYEGQEFSGIILASKSNIKGFQYLKKMGWDVFVYNGARLANISIVQLPDIVRVADRVIDFIDHGVEFSNDREQLLAALKLVDFMSNNLNEFVPDTRQRTQTMFLIENSRNKLSQNGYELNHLDNQLMYSFSRTVIAGFRLRMHKDPKLIRFDQQVQRPRKFIIENLTDRLQKAKPFFKEKGLDEKVSQKLLSILIWEQFSTLLMNVVDFEPIYSDEYGAILKSLIEQGLVGGWVIQDIAQLDRETPSARAKSNWSYMKKIIDVLFVGEEPALQQQFLAAVMEFNQEYSVAGNLDKETEQAIFQLNFLSYRHLDRFTPTSSLSAVGRRIVRHKLLPSEIVEAYEKIQRAMRTKGLLSPELVYDLSAADISSALLLTDAETFYFNDALAFGFDADPNDPRYARLKEAYLIDKSIKGYSNGVLLESIGSVRVILEWELEMLGARNIRIERNASNLDRYEVSFDWSYDGSEAFRKPRKIIYTQGTFESDDGFAAHANSLTGGMYLRKADMGLFAISDIKMPVLISFENSENLPGYDRFPLTEMVGASASSVYISQPDTNYADVNKGSVYVRKENAPKHDVKKGARLATEDQEHLQRLALELAVSRSESELGNEIAVSIDDENPSLFRVSVERDAEGALIAVKMFLRGDDQPVVDLNGNIRQRLRNLQATSTSPTDVVRDAVLTPMNIAAMRADAAMPADLEKETLGAYGLAIPMGRFAAWDSVRFEAQVKLLSRDIKKAKEKSKYKKAVYYLEGTDSFSEAQRSILRDEIQKAGLGEDVQFNAADKFNGIVIRIASPDDEEALGVESNALIFPVSGIQPDALLGWYEALRSATFIATALGGLYTEAGLSHQDINAASVPIEVFEHFNSRAEHRVADRAAFADLLTGRMHKTDRARFSFYLPIIERVPTDLLIAAARLALRTAGVSA